MKNTILFISNLLLVFVFTNCATDKNMDNPLDPVQEGTYVQNSLENSDVIPNQLSVYRAANPILTDLIHTKLAVSLDWAKSQLNGMAEITCTPHFYENDSLILHAKGMNILSIQLNGSRPFKYDSTFLRISLDRKYQKGEKFTVKINYISRPNGLEITGSKAITSDKGLYFINPTNEEGGYMPQVWTQGETESSSVWFPTIDSPNQKSTQEIAITVDKKYVTLSNGLLKSQIENGNGTRTDLWVQDKPHAPYLFMLAAGEFVIVKDEYIRQNGSKMEVNYYVEPKYKDDAKAIFGETPKMIAFFSQLLEIDYPWDKYHQIVTREYVSGAMENTGAVVFGDYVYKDKRELLDENDNSTIAHELFHHWFGDLVTCESWSNLTVNESFANYSQYLWDEHRYGVAEADYMGRKEMNAYFNEYASGTNHDLVNFEYDSQEDMFDAHTYNKGGRILHMLRSIIGDKAFFKGMNVYLTQNKFKAAEAQQLRLAFEEVTGQDLNWFFNQWYYGNGFPTLEVNHTHEFGSGLTVVSVEQNQVQKGGQLFKIPLQIAVYDAAGKTIHTVVIDKRQQTFTLPVRGELKTVVFDHQSMLLAQIDEKKPDSFWKNQFELSERVLTKNLAMENLEDNFAENELFVSKGLKDAHWSIRAKTIGFVTQLKELETRRKYKEAISDLLKSDKNYQVRQAAVSYLESITAPQDFLFKLEDIIQSDSSYNVISTCLGKLYGLDSSKALPIARLFAAQKLKPMYSIVCQIIAVGGNKSDIPFFESQLSGNIDKGNSTFDLINGYAVLISKSDSKGQTEAIAIFKNLVKKTSGFTKQFVQGAAKYISDEITNNQAASAVNKANAEAYKQLSL